MGDANFTVNLKAIMDISDVKHNVDQIQQKFNNLNIAPKLKDSLNKDLNNFYKEYNKYTAKVDAGIKTQGDYNSVVKSLNSMQSAYERIGKEAEKIAGIKPTELFKDTPQLQNFSKQIENLKQQLATIKIDPQQIEGPLNQIKNLTTNIKAKGLVSDLIGANAKGDFETVIKKAQELELYVKRATAVMQDGTKASSMRTAMDSVTQAISGTSTQAGKLAQDIANCESKMNSAASSMSQGAKDAANSFRQTGNEFTNLAGKLAQMHKEDFGMSRQIEMIDRQVQSYFGLSQIIRKVGNIARQAWSTIKDLDKSMTATAVVTNFDVGDMWDKLPQYTAAANQLGSTIKDVYDATTLYYQQGLNSAQAMGVATETLKMARIGGLEAAEATDMMTAALRGFNMQVNEMSAQRINDVYSKLAAITASNTKELGEAMTRTASIANSAHMEFETTSAFLAQMIETTREAPENLGTAMKTIIARFQEMKKSPEEFIDEDGTVTNINRVDTALRTVGVSLTDAEGNFRKLDDVFLDLASRWSGLSQGQQRYIATMAAGSRQQSRFIAMMSNYDRTMELVNAANNSAGASNEQFGKTLESMDSKLNKMKNAWNEFAMGLLNNDISKFIVDSGTQAFTIINKVIDVLGSIPPKPFEGVTKSLLTLIATFKMLTLARGIVSKGLVAGVSWMGGEDVTKRLFGNSSMMQATAQGTKVGQAFSNGALSAIEGMKGRATQTLSNLIPVDVLTTRIQQGFAKSAPQMRTSLEKVFHASMANANISGKDLPRVMHTWQNQMKQLEGGKIDMSQVVAEMKDVGVAIDENALKAELFTNKMTQMGSKITAFGTAVSNIPGLEGLGSVLTRIGMLVTTLGTTFAFASTAAKEAAIASLGDAAAKEVEAGATVGAAMAHAGFTASIKASIAALKAFWLNLGPIGWAITAVIALAAAFKAVVAIIGALDLDGGKKLESLQDQAKAASDRFSSLKQETSELTDALSQLDEIDNAFDGLVVGSAAFNEKLIESNKLVNELLEKYPALNDEKYVSTDENGRKIINQEGRDYIINEQNRKLAQAQALKAYTKTKAENQKLANDIAAIEKEYQDMQNAAKKGGKSNIYNYDEREADYEQQIKDLKFERKTNNQKLAQSMAADIANTHPELSTEDKNLVSQAGGQYLQSLIKNVDTNVTQEEMRETYAKANNLTYNKSEQKFRDIEGTDVTEDVKDLADNKENYKALKGMEQFYEKAPAYATSVHKLDQAWADMSDHADESGNFMTQLLSGDTEINENALRQFAESNGSMTTELIKNMTDAELKAMGLTRETAADELDKLADNLVESKQKESNELGIMFARSMGASLSNDGTMLGLDEQAVAQEIARFTEHERAFMARAGKEITNAFGSETTSAFIQGMRKIYQQGNADTNKEVEDAFGAINWENSATILTQFTNIAKSTDPVVRELGNSLLNTGESNELFRDAILDVQDAAAEAKVELLEFADANGEFDAEGIYEAADKVTELRDLLDSGAVSASGLAMTINSVGGLGNLASLNSGILEIINSLGKVDDVAHKAHQAIEDFEEGIDTGESDDWIKEKSKTALDFISTKDENGNAKLPEWGNEQLHNIIKQFVGEDKWNDALQKHNGNLAATVSSFKPVLNNLKDGFLPAWGDLASGVDAYGEQIKDIPKKFKNIKASFDEKGQFKLDIGDAGTDEVLAYLQEVYKVGEDTAEQMLATLLNYSEDLTAELRSNDFLKEVQNGDWLTPTNQKNGAVGMSTSSIQAIAAANPEYDYEGVVKLMKKEAKAKGVNFVEIKNVDEKGQLINDYKDLNKQVNKAFTDGWVKVSGDTVDLAASIKNAQSTNIDASQVEGILWEEFQRLRGEGKAFEYEGQVVNPDEITTSKDLMDFITKAQSNEQWTTAGQAMADPIADAVYNAAYDGIKGNEPGTTGGNNNNNNNNTEPTGSSPSTETTTIPVSGGSVVINSEGGVVNKSDSPSLQGKPSDGTTIPGVGYVERSAEGVAAALDEHKTAVEGDTQATTTHSETTEKNPMSPAEFNTKYKQSVDTSGFDSATESAEQAGNQAKAAASEFKDAGEKTKTYSRDATKAGSNAEQANQAVVSSITAGLKGLQKSATKFSQSAQPSESKQGKPPQGTTVPGVGYVDKSGKVLTGTSPQGQIQPEEQTIHTTIKVDDAELVAVKKKITQVQESASEGATLEVSASISGNISKAQKALNTLKQSSGQKVSSSVKVNSTGDAGGIKTITQAAARAKASISVSANTTNAYNQLATLKSYASKDVSFGVNVKSGQQRHFTVSVEGKYTGQNNTGRVPQVPSFGSLAAGTSRPGIGRLGPKGKGGLTLTGELGYEVAWLPREGRSMILGAKGPEMVDLPGDAVIWNHEQSEKIIKKKQIPNGSAAVGAGSAWQPTDNNLTYLAGQFFRRSVGANNTGTNYDKGAGASKKDQKKAAKNNKHLTTNWKLKKEVGKTNTKIYNTEKKIEQVQNNIEILQEEINKQLEKSAVTIKSVIKNGNSQIKQLQLSYNLNKKLEKLYNDRLKRADKSKKKSANVDISWSDTYQRKNKGKKETKTKRKKASVNLSKYISYDSATGAYQLNQKELNKVYKKNKNKGKAIRTAAEKQINENTSKRDSAAKAAREAEQKLEELGKQLYDTFYGWENELTKILNLTNKIAETESKITRLKGAQSLNEAMLGSGLQKLTQSFIKETIGLFTQQTANMANEIRQRTTQIQQQKEAIKKAISVADEKEEVATLQKRQDIMTKAENQQATLDKATSKEKSAKAKLKKDQKTVDNGKKLIKGKVTNKKINTKIDKEEDKAEKASKKITSEKKKIQKLKKQKKEAASKKKKAAIEKKIDKEEKKLEKQQSKKKKANKNVKTLKQYKKIRKNGTIAKDEKALEKATTARKTAADNLENTKKLFDQFGITGYSATEILANTKRLEVATEKQKEVKKAQKYISAITNPDGTISLEIDSEALEADKDAGLISEEMYNAIKDYYDSAKETNDELVELYNDQLSALEEMYSLISELKEQYADYADELMDAIEEAQQDEIDKLSKLNDALTNHLKNLLDEVKRRLDQRRQQEDNAKTESDIAKKQQRLATLQADTSGGHASEIAQLQQEIAEAQQSYGRTLEDQTLQRLEEQADKAAEQRQHQIDLLQAQLEVGQALGNNVTQVNDLLQRLELIESGIVEKQQRIDTLKADTSTDHTDEIAQLEQEIGADSTVLNTIIEEVRALLKHNKKYDEQNIARQKVLDDEINQIILGLTTLPLKIAAATEETTGLENDVAKIKEAVLSISNTAAGKGITGTRFLEEQKKLGVDANTAISAALSKGLEVDYEDLKDVGYTAQDFKDSGIDINNAKTAFTNGELKTGGYTAKDFYEGNISYDEIKSLYSNKELVNAGFKEAKDIETNTENSYNNFLKKRGSEKNSGDKNWGKIGADGFKAQVNRGKILGYSVAKVATDLANTKALTWKEVLTAAKKAGYSAKTIKSWNPNATKTSAFRKAFNDIFTKGWSKYASGGMNYTTGPAWLDGTRAKPEAVLNATDTKNFIALKDILSDIMGHITDNNTTTYGDSTYEININVDHLNNDYDVDKVAKRVEKIITEDASYRNVTMVRKFR